MPVYWLENEPKTFTVVVTLNNVRSTYFVASHVLAKVFQIHFRNFLPYWILCKTYIQNNGAVLLIVKQFSLYLLPLASHFVSSNFNTYLYHSSSEIDLLSSAKIFFAVIQPPVGDT